MMDVPNLKFPIFAPAFRTQTQTNTQPNMHLTHNPSSITRNPAENHAFSSKERDVETGLSYFGARYYSSELSLWLSVDPMVDKYPSLSPYVYCANNPVKLVDPNGEEIINPDDPPKNKSQNNSKSSTTTTVGISKTYNGLIFNASVSTTQTKGEQKLHRSCQYGFTTPSNLNSLSLKL